jgi:hypothetical protein
MDTGEKSGDPMLGIELLLSSRGGMTLGVGTIF